MNSSQERLAFSERLQQALRNAEYSPHSPTQLAREFNERFKGHPVGWLDVPADWLRFGNGDTRKGGGADTSMTDQRATALLSQLDEHHRQIGLDMLRALVRTYKKK
jgi:hypothetical protein